MRSIQIPFNFDPYFNPFKSGFPPIIIGSVSTAPLLVIRWEHNAGVSPAAFFEVDYYDYYNYYLKGVRILGVPYTHKPAHPPFHLRTCQAFPPPHKFQA